MRTRDVALTSSRTVETTINCLDRAPPRRQLHQSLTTSCQPLLARSGSCAPHNPVVNILTPGYTQRWRLALRPSRPGQLRRQHNNPANDGLRQSGERRPWIAAVRPTASRHSWNGCRAGATLWAEFTTGLLSQAVEAPGLRVRHRKCHCHFRIRQHTFCNGTGRTTNSNVVQKPGWSGSLNAGFANVDC